MNSSDSVLVLSTMTSSDLWLGHGCPVGFDDLGDPIHLDTLNPDHFGRPYLSEDSGNLEWFATTRKSSMARLEEFYPFHGGAMISPRVRDVIERFDSRGIEFIPLKIVHRKTRAPIDDWWFVNVFHWKDAFDLEKSRATWLPFSDPVSGYCALEHKFGALRMSHIQELAALPAAYEGGLYLAKAPTQEICLRVFIGMELASRINEALPEKKKVYFELFPLRDRFLFPSIGGC